MSPDQLITISNNVIHIWKKISTDVQSTKSELVTQLTSSNEIVVNHISKEGGVQLKLATPTKAILQKSQDNKITKSLKRYIYKSPPHCKPCQLFLAPPTQSGIQLSRIAGFNNFGRNNIYWDPLKGIIITVINKLL